MREARRFGQLSKRDSLGIMPVNKRDGAFDAVVPVGNRAAGFRAVDGRRPDERAAAVVEGEDAGDPQVGRVVRGMGVGPFDDGLPGSPHLAVAIHVDLGERRGEDFGAGLADNLHLVLEVAVLQVLPVEGDNPVLVVDDEELGVGDEIEHPPEDLDVRPRFAEEVALEFSFLPVRHASIVEYCTGRYFTIFRRDCTSAILQIMG